MKIKQLRLKLNLTQQEMADSIGIERSLYNKIELGKNNLTVEQIKRLVKVHGVNPNWILFEEGQMINSNDIENFSNTFKNNLAPKIEGPTKSIKKNKESRLQLRMEEELMLKSQVVAERKGISLAGLTRMLLIKEIEAYEEQYGEIKIEPKV